MKTRLRIEPNDQSVPNPNPNPDLQRETSAYKCKILPYLRSINYQCQPIDYRLYQKIRKTKRVQIIRPENSTNLFLEGEGAYSAPSQKKYHNQGNLMHLLTVHQKEKVANKRLHRIFPERQSHTKSQRHPHEQKPQGTLPSDKPFLPKKVPSICASVQSPVKSESSRKQNPAPNLKSNWSIQMKSSVDLQKPVIYLDKKQLSQIKAESFVVMEYPTLQVITGNRFKNSAEIASLTKIMTFYTAYQIAVERYVDIGNCFAVIDEEAGEMTGTSAELIAGDVISIEQLLYGLMLPSGNDAALALANWGGALINSNPEEITPLNAFIQRMNRNAKELQMRQSTFGNPHGLPNYRNASNPYDLALLIARCLHIPLFSQIVSTPSYRTWITNEGAKKEVIWENTNKLLRRKGFVGVKTGVTVTAGPCLATCYERGDRKFIVVLLRTSKLSRRFKQTRLVLGWALRRYNSDLYHSASKQILHHDAILDSDNSEDEQQFHYQKLDAQQLAKRNKILVYEL